VSDDSSERETVRLREGSECAAAQRPSSSDLLTSPTYDSVIKHYKIMTFWEQTTHIHANTHTHTHTCGHTLTRVHTHQPHAWIIPFPIPCLLLPFPFPPFPFPLFPFPPFPFFPSFPTSFPSLTFRIPHLPLLPLPVLPALFLRQSRYRRATGTAAAMRR